MPDTMTTAEERQTASLPMWARAATVLTASLAVILICLGLVYHITVKQAAQLDKFATAQDKHTEVERNVATALENIVKGWEVDRAQGEATRTEMIRVLRHFCRISLQDKDWLAGERCENPDAYVPERPRRR